MMPTGHHQVADALIRSLSSRTKNVHCAKIDFVSYVGETFEKIVTNTYLKWIIHSPQTYHMVYRHFMYPNRSRRWRIYETLFLKKMEELLADEKPDLLVCTQALPSFLISKLKLEGKISTPAVNVYTDFFINGLWGREGIDFHFVPDVPMKLELIENHSIPADKIFVTGIPVDECFTIEKVDRDHTLTPPYRILISGGNNGLGQMQDLLTELDSFTKCEYLVLCGKNHKLYQEIKSMGLKSIKPLPYISSREEMNKLYSSAHAIVTKPGGVTVSECLKKKLPIFIHSVLPGQEEINRNYLSNQALVYNLDSSQPIGKQLIDFLSNGELLSSWFKPVNRYHKRIEVSAWQKILSILESEPEESFILPREILASTRSVSKI